MLAAGLSKKPWRIRGCCCAAKGATELFSDAFICLCSRLDRSRSRLDGPLL